jgi:hypothetical protein
MKETLKRKFLPTPHGYSDEKNESASKRSTSFFLMKNSSMKKRSEIKSRSNQLQITHFDPDKVNDDDLKRFEKYSKFSTLKNDHFLIKTVKKPIQKPQDQNSFNNYDAYKMQRIKTTHSSFQKKPSKFDERMLREEIRETEKQKRFKSKMGEWKRLFVDQTSETVQTQTNFETFDPFGYQLVSNINQETIKDKQIMETNFSSETILDSIGQISMNKSKASIATLALCKLRFKKFSNLAASRVRLTSLSALSKTQKTGNSPRKSIHPRKTKMYSQFENFTEEGIPENSSSRLDSDDNDQTPTSGQVIKTKEKISFVNATNSGNHISGYQLSNKDQTSQDIKVNADSPNDQSMASKAYNDNLARTFLKGDDKTVTSSDHHEVKDANIKALRFRLNYEAQNSPSLSSFTSKGQKVIDSKIDFTDTYYVFTALKEPMNQYLCIKLEDIGFSYSPSKSFNLSFVNLSIKTKINTQKLQLLRFEPVVKEKLNLLLKEFLEFNPDSILIADSHGNESQLYSLMSMDSFTKKLFKEIHQIMFCNFSMVSSVLGQRLSPISQKDTELYKKIKESINASISTKMNVQNNFIRKLGVVFRRVKEIVTNYHLSTLYSNSPDKMVIKRSLMKSDNVRRNISTMSFHMVKNNSQSNFDKAVRERIIYSPIDQSKVKTFAFYNRFMAVFSIFINDIGHLVIAESIYNSMKRNSQFSLKIIVVDTQTQFIVEENFAEIFPRNSFVRKYIENESLRFLRNRKTSVEFISQIEQKIKHKFENTPGYLKKINVRHATSCTSELKNNTRNNHEPKDLATNIIRERRSKIQIDRNSIFKIDIDKVKILVPQFSKEENDQNNLVDLDLYNSLFRFYKSNSIIGIYKIKRIDEDANFKCHIYK